MRSLQLFAFAIGITGITVNVQAQSILFVDASAPHSGDGSSWSRALNDLQDALDEAEARSGFVEIWVAEGTYRPSERIDPNDPRSATFSLVDTISIQGLLGVAVYGGFAGIETERERRDPSIHETVLSGDLLGDDEADAGSRADNSYHVLSGRGADKNFRLMCPSWCEGY